MSRPLPTKSLTMRKHLIVLSESASFPWGMAAANRVRNLCKGLMQQGWNVEYLGLRGADVIRKNGKKYKACGKEDGVLFCYPGRIPIRSSSWWLRRFDDFLGCLLTLLALVIKKLLHKADAVIIYSNHKNITRLWVFYLHFLKIPVILEVCEWPLAVAEVRGSGHKDAEQFCRNIVPTVDAVLPISSYIDHEIKKMAGAKGRTLPSFKIPILIDSQDGDLESDKSQNKRYMLYCGSMAYMDIARIVVDIVYELKAQGIHLPIKFTGKNDNICFAELKSYAEHRDVLSYFEFTDFIEEKELHKLMSEATCLLAPLPENSQSESRFSTKIGYYLASGTPVVTNGVGDVQIYLQDGINGFVTKNCDPLQFASKISQIISGPNVARDVGLAGRELALDKFHFSRACVGLSDFIVNVVEECRQKKCA